MRSFCIHFATYGLPFLHILANTCYCLSFYCSRGSFFVFLCNVGNFMTPWEYIPVWLSEQLGSYTFCAPFNVQWPDNQGGRELSWDSLCWNIWDFLNVPIGEEVGLMTPGVVFGFGSFLWSSVDPPTCISENWCWLFSGLSLVSSQKAFHFPCSNREKTRLVRSPN